MSIYQGYPHLLSRYNPILLHFFVDAQMYVVYVQFVEWIAHEHLMFAKAIQLGKITPHQRRDF